MDEELWIIDGHNLMRRDPELARLERERGFGAARAVVESQLAGFRARKGRGHSVVLVFDGAPDPADGPPLSTRGFRVLYGSGPGGADAVVLEQARRAEGRSRVHIVTSDVQDLAGRLRGLRVQVHRVEEFRGELWGRGARAARATEKPAPPRGAEVDEWLRRFEPGAASPAPGDRLSGDRLSGDRPPGGGTPGGETPGGETHGG